MPWNGERTSRGSNRPVKADKLPSWLELSPVMDVITDESLPLELFILKSHLVIEVHLYHILSVRLQIDREHLPPLTFFPLAKLALGGAHAAILPIVLALNDLRNEFSHELNPTRLDAAFGKFVSKAGYFWPEHDPYDKPAEFASVRDAAIRAAGGDCVGQVFWLFVDVALTSNAIPAEEAVAAETIVKGIRDVLEITRSVQGAVRLTVAEAIARRK